MLKFGQKGLFGSDSQLICLLSAPNMGPKWTKQKKIQKKATNQKDL
jgi:hypothetical protein